MLLFITHAKAGSTWVDGILRSLLGRRVDSLSYRGFDFSYRRGHVATIFLNRTLFLSRPEFAGAQRFILIRDLRDTLVSWYYSMRGAHELDPGGQIATARAELQNMGREEGMIHLLSHQGFENTAEVQRSWLGTGEEILRYEDLIADDLRHFRCLFLEKLQLPVTAAQVEKAVLANRFETRYGRKLGVEDTASHGRKGTPGDWRNQFTPALAEAFHARFGELLLASGAESDPEWWRKVELATAA